MSSSGPAAERELVRRCLSGDDAAWEELVALLGPAARASARRAVARALGGADQAAVEDAAQGAFEELVADGFASLRRFEWGCSLESYVSVIAARSAADLVKSRIREEQKRARADRLGELAARGRGADGPEEAALRGELSAVIDGAIGALPAAQALSARLYYFDGRSVAEIAEFRGVPYGTVTSDLGRARAALRAILGED